MRPVLRYHGGKWRIAPWIISHFPAHRIYVEPFAGATSVFFRKPKAANAFLSDASPDVVHYLETVRVNHRALAAAISRIRYSPRTYRAAYARDALEHAGDVQRAAIMAVRSFMGHGSDSLWRRNGFRSHPIAADAWKTLPGAIVEAGEKMRENVQVRHMDATQAILQFDRPDALIYADPPYPDDVRGSDRRDRYDVEMRSESEHGVLAYVLRSSRAKVVVSGYPCPLYDRLYVGWQAYERPSMADGARPRVEKIWIKP